MPSKLYSLILASTFTIGMVTLVACTPEQPPAVDETVEAPPVVVDEVPRPCGGENCQEP